MHQWGVYVKLNSAHQKQREAKKASNCKLQFPFLVKINCWMNIYSFLLDLTNQTATLKLLRAQNNNGEHAQNNKHFFSRWKQQKVEFVLEISLCCVVK